MDTLIQDLRFALRTLLRAPGFTAVAVLTLALGVGGTTAVLSVTHALFFGALAVPEPGRVVTLAEHRADGTVSHAVRYPEYLAYRDGAQTTFEELAAAGGTTLALRTPAGAMPLEGDFVSGNYFSMLRLRPSAGRLLEPTDDVPGSPPVVVLSHDLWSSRFGGDPGVVGSTVHLNGQMVTVAGVAPAGFRGSRLTGASQFWVPLAARELLAPRLVEGPGQRVHWLWVQGRLAPGVDRASASAALEVVGARLGADREEGRGVRAAELMAAGTVPATLRSDAAALSGLLIAAAALLLVLASVNVAGMLVARATGRRREVAIRLAVGAGSGRLRRQLLTESALLFVLGAGAGILLGWVLIAPLVALVSVPGGPLALRTLEVNLDPRILAATLAVTLAVGVLAGLAPAIQAGRTRLSAALRDGAGSGRERTLLGGGLVVGQVALCILLLMTAGLFLRSLQEAGRVELGFDARHVLTARLAPPGYDADRTRALYAELAERVAAAPGVHAVSYSDVHPLWGAEVTTGIQVEGGETVELHFNPVSRGYFETLGIPLLQGRTFDGRDGVGSPAVAVVNESFVRRHLPGGSAVGSSVRIGREATEIVGVVSDSKWGALDEEGFPFAYTPLEREFAPAVSILVRHTGDAAGVEALLRRELQALDPDLPLTGVGTLEETVRLVTLPQRIAARGAMAFGAAGLLLAMVGLYGLLAYLVGQRTREIGVRMALGARPADVVALVVRRGAALTAAGAALGIAASLSLLPLLGGMLFGVGAADPRALSGVLLLLSSVALAASLLPARRAARVDPMTALRAE